MSLGILLSFSLGTVGASMSSSFLGETGTSFLQTLFCHRLSRLTLSQFLALLVVFFCTLALSSSYEGLAFSKHLFSSLTELDGPRLEQG